MRNTSNDHNFRPDRYVFIKRPACPECDSRELKMYRSVEVPDPYEVHPPRKRWTLCLACSHRFFVIEED